jgi:hypothetical protein
LKEKVSEYNQRTSNDRQLAIDALGTAATAEERTAALAKLGDSETAKVAGLSVRHVWDFEIVDENALPRLYLMPNEKIIKAQIALGVRTIEGVRIFQREEVASRAS